jgi:hypothetical protein
MFHGRYPYGLTLEFPYCGPMKKTGDSKAPDCHVEWQRSESGLTKRDNNSGPPSKPARNSPGVAPFHTLDPCPIRDEVAGENLNGGWWMDFHVATMLRL